MCVPNQEFWRGLNVLVTGHTGFKGAWLTTWLRSLGANVMGLSLPHPPTSPSLWRELGISIEAEALGDIAIPETWSKKVNDFSPQVIFHLAAQPLVSEGFRQPSLTFTSNVEGTNQLLQFANELENLKVLLVVTTDKVYDPRQDLPHSEEAFLGGHDPYSASKAAVELLVASWPNHRCNIAVARAGNVIGGGDWAKNRLLPDLISAWQEGKVASLRFPTATRPWQHVMEPLRGYLIYAEALASQEHVTKALNFGPSPEFSLSVKEVSQLCASSLGVKEKALFREDPDGSALRETAELSLDSSRARLELNWTSVINAEHAVGLTVDWFRRYYSGASSLEITEAQIREYVNHFSGGQVE